MQRTPPLLTSHRRARLTLLLRLALLWAAAMLSGALAPNRRHIAQRHGWLGADRLVRLACDLAIVRAAELAHLPLGRKTPSARDFAARGIRRRMRPNALRRAALGARVRRWLRADPLARALDVLADLDAFVRRHLLKRARRRLTKLCPLIAKRPPAHGFASAPAFAPPPADSS